VFNFARSPIEFHFHLQRQKYQEAAVTQTL